MMGKTYTTFAPIELHELVMEGEISPSAAWLAMIIYNLSKGKRGCYASNGYLAKKISRSISQIAVLLRKLEKVHLLKSEWVGQERRLRIDLTCSTTDKRADKCKKEAIIPVEEDKELGPDEPYEELKKMKYSAYLQSNHWKRKRSKSLSRAKYRCQLCNSDQDLNVHHRTYKNLGKEDYSDLTVLCTMCHEKHHDILPIWEE